LNINHISFLWLYPNDYSIILCTFQSACQRERKITKFIVCSVNTWSQIKSLSNFFDKSNVKVTVRSWQREAVCQKISLCCSANICVYLWYCFSSLGSSKTEKEGCVAEKLGGKLRLSCVACTTSFLHYLGENSFSQFSLSWPIWVNSKHAPPAPPVRPSRSSPWWQLD